jgi:hypothetical protein
VFDLFQFQPSYQKVDDQPAIKEGENNADNKERGHERLRDI